jgi:hypothetical protein
MRAGMRAVRGLTILGLALVMMGHTPGAWACSCVGTTPADSFKAADVVFVGTVISREDPNTGTAQSSTDPIVWTFTVKSVQKGATPGTTTVKSARDGASCGFVFSVGRRYQVFANKTFYGLATNLCTGTAALVAGASAFHVSSSGLAHTGRSPILAVFLGAAFLAAGAVIAREGRKRAYFTWPR